MKKLVIYISVFIVGAVILSGCNHKFDEYNKDPNDLEFGQVPAIHLLTNVIFSGADGFLYRTWQINGELIQYTVNMHTENVHRYMIRESYITGAWDHLARWAANADHMREVAISKQDPACEAIALTMRALYMSNLTDMFGDVPFSEAFQGRAEVPNTKPIFDTQEEVYRQLYEDLERANTLYMSAPEIEAEKRSYDILYGGDLAKWRRFNNSLYLRLLTRMINRDAEMNVSAKIQEVCTRTADYPVFESNDDNATIFYSGESPFWNRFGQNTGDAFTTNSRRYSEFFINTLSSYGDPRLGIIGVMYNSEWTGMVSGYPSDETQASNCASLNKSLLGDYASPYSFMRYDEILFIKAEMAHKGVISGGETAAGNYYHDGILNSINHWDEINPGISRVTEEQRRQYLQRVAYNNEFEQIMLQKYIALFWVGYEAYSEYRRTGYPVLKIGTGTANDGVLPTRLPYPISTFSTNRENYEKAVQHMGGDDMKTPVWWSKKATDK